VPAVESVVNESGSVHGFDDVEDGSEHGKPLLTIWPAVLFEPLDEFVDGSHAFELFGDNDALLVSVDLSAGEVNDVERGHSGCFEFLIILPLDLEGWYFSGLEKEVVREVVLLALEIDGAPVRKFET